MGKSTADLFTTVSLMVSSQSQDFSKGAQIDPRVILFWIPISHQLMVFASFPSNFFDDFFGHRILLPIAP